MSDDGAYVLFNDEQKTKVAITDGGKPKVYGHAKIVKKELLPFNQKLSALLEAGVPLLEALDGLADQTDHVEFKKVILFIHGAIEAGSTLSEAMKEFPKIFNDLYISTIEAGEQSGSLDMVVDRMATYFANAADMRRRIKGAMMYPIIVLVVSVAIVIYLMISVVPSIAETFMGLGNTDLPIVTVYLLAMSDFVQVYYIEVVVAPVVFWFGLKLLRKNRSIAYFLDRHVLKMPIFGKLISMIVMSRFARTFSSLTASGLPLLKTLELVGRTSGNLFITDVMGGVKGKVENGMPISESMYATKVFPKMMMQMITTGESSGRIDTMLEKVADFYEAEVKELLEGLSTMIEPIMIVGLGGMILFIAVGLFTPLFKMAEALM